MNPNTPASSAQPHGGAINAYTYPMTIAPGVVQGSVSPFREGYISLTAQGVRVSGKVVLQQDKLIGFLLLGYLGTVIAEHAGLKSHQVTIGWAQVEAIVLEREKRRACVVYASQEDAPLFRSVGYVSLSFCVFGAGLYENFVQAARYFAPRKVREGKIGTAEPVTALFVLLGILAVIVLLLYGISR